MPDWQVSRRRQPGTPSRFSPKITPALSECLESLWHKQRMHAHRTKNVDGRATTRSKVSNGTRLFANTDGRTSSARRFRDLVQSFEAEFDGDLCEADRSLIRQAATLLLKSEQMQEAVVRGESVDSDALIRMASTAKRVLVAITAKSAKRKPAGPSLQDYLASASSCSRSSPLSCTTYFFTEISFAAIIASAACHAAEANHKIMVLAN